MTFSHLVVSCVHTVVAPRVIRLVAAWLFGLFTVASSSASLMDSAAVTALTGRLQSKDAKMSAAAVGQIALALSDGSDQTVINALRITWLPWLLDERRNEDASKLALDAILNYSSENVDQFFHCRVQALLAEGKVDEALSTSKSYFNCSRLRDTADAIQMVVEALRCSRPFDKGIGARFRKEQMVEAGLLPTSFNRSPAYLMFSGNVLSTVICNESTYLASIERWRRLPGAQAELHLGNLYLMAGFPMKALECFSNLYISVDDSQLVSVSEAIARAIRAEDGNVERANAWVLRIRPAGSTSIKSLSL